MQFDQRKRRAFITLLGGAARGGIPAYEALLAGLLSQRRLERELVAPADEVIR
jgi:hypothetical protein